MANIDKGRNKWENARQDEMHDMRFKDDMKTGRKGKPQVEIYRPGSGPLRRTGQGEEEFLGSDESCKVKSSTENMLFTNTHDLIKYDTRKPSFSSSQEQLSRPFKSNSDRSENINCAKNSRDINKVSDRFGSLSMNQNMPNNMSRRNSLDQSSSSDSKLLSGDQKKKLKKPEQPIYVPKPLAQAYAEKDLTNKSLVDVNDKRVANNTKEENWDNELQQQDLFNEGGTDSWDRDGVYNRRDNLKRNNKFDSGRRIGQRPTPQCDWRVPNREIRQASEPPVCRWAERKPPSGRRGSKDRPHFEGNNLPPRFQKLRSAENGSASYGGAAQSYVPSQSQQEHTSSSSYSSQHYWSHTLPHAKGRGRLRPDEVERFSRSLTPDRLTPSQVFYRTPSQENVAPVLSLTQPFPSRGISQAASWMEHNNCAPSSSSPPVGGHAASMGPPRFRRLNDNVGSGGHNWDVNNANNRTLELTHKTHEFNHSENDTSLFREIESNHAVPESAQRPPEHRYKVNSTSYQVPELAQRVKESFYKISESNSRIQEPLGRIPNSDYKAVEANHNSIDHNQHSIDANYSPVDGKHKVPNTSCKGFEVNHLTPDLKAKGDDSKVDENCSVSEATNNTGGTMFKESDLILKHKNLNHNVPENTGLVELTERLAGPFPKEPEIKAENVPLTDKSEVCNNSPPPKPLDWSEEVERVVPISSVFPQDWGDEVEQSEREAQQMGRSSSLASLLHPDSSGGGGALPAAPSTRNKKKRKTRRSMSRERILNHDSVDDKMFCGPSVERNRGRGPSDDRNRNRGHSSDRNRNRGYSGDRNQIRGASGDRNRHRMPSSERNRNRLPSTDRKIGEPVRNRAPSWEHNRNRGQSRERKGGNERDRNRHRGSSHERNRNRGPSIDKGKSRGHSPERNRNRGPSQEKGRNRNSPDRMRNRGNSPDKLRGRMTSSERNKNRGQSPEKVRNRGISPRSNRGPSSERNRNRGQSAERKVAGGGNRNRGASGERKRNRSGERKSRRRGGRGTSRDRRALPSDTKNLGGTLGAPPPPSHTNIAGILVLPPGEQGKIMHHHHHHQQQNQPSLSQQQSATYVVPQQRHLYDPSNPNKPILVQRTNTRSARDAEIPMSPVGCVPGQSLLSPSMDYCFSESLYGTESFGNARPSWYGPYSSSFRNARDPRVILDIDRADQELQWILSSGSMLSKWRDIFALRRDLQIRWKTLLETDLKLCEAENVEQHMWKLTFYNIIELLRKGMLDDPENKEQYKFIMLNLIEEGTAYFEQLLSVLEQTYNFSLDSFLASSNMPTKGLGLVGLALISAQKIFLYLGDLARYKEQINETSNFGKSRQYYIRAHQINPKNGRPYNQLAILALYARRKLDAVYYYMRSLMASNPVQSARESLLSLFDENRKKFEQSERRRREEREQKQRERMKEKEGAGVRREVWIHPEGRRRRLHVTTSAGRGHDIAPDSEEEELAALSSIEVNKRFVISYLNVQGKLFTKVGMETFQESALQMLKEFRALLQHSPVPLNAIRFLQLLALNMFAIENTQLKETQLEPGYRPAVQESALVVSLEMFSLILEKCIELLRTAGSVGEPGRIFANEDLQILLPAVKVWCDWLLCHSAVWNPPPCCSDYRIGPNGDAWSRVATLVNILERIDIPHVDLVQNPRDGYEMVRLPEDATLSGFTPLMYNMPESYYTSNDTDMELAQVALRIQRIVFFGSEFLCGVDPPVLKLQKIDGETSEYVSVVDSSGSGSLLPVSQLTSELRMESFSDEDTEESVAIGSVAGGSELPLSGLSQDTRNLLSRKEQLERDSHSQQKYRQYVQAILQDAVVLVEIEVKPRYLVPDTNCFIDYLSLLQKISQTMSNLKHLYMLMVPLVVLQELEGLARGGPRGNLPAEHIARVAEAARNALAYVRSRPGGVKCVTSQGSILASAAFTDEQDSMQDKRNDDRILATTLSLCRTSDKEETKPGETRRLYREVVLLTEDRNLRVKALGLDVPVREVPDFVRWAGLG